MIIEGGNRYGSILVVSLDDQPLNVEQIDMRVAIHGAAGKTAHILDENGYPTQRRADTKAWSPGLAIHLPPDAIYTLVE